MAEDRSDLRHIRDERDVQEAMDVIFSSSSSSTDTESECEEHPKCSNFEATLDSMSEMDFKLHMRLKRETVDYLICK